MVGDRRDADIVENPAGPHQALGLLDEADRDALAGLEKQLAPDDRGARLNVKEVGGTVQDAVLLRVLEVEDIQVVDADLADDRAGRLELGEGGDFLLRGGFLRVHGSQRAGESDAAAGQQPEW
ncbi:MAG: hypothetical protein E6H80_08920 [Betaproteobacteria bacterium]|nr:MAG: hypothetical protein E6H80_08920 [Betaproteobacteria bacterium]